MPMRELRRNTVTALRHVIWIFLACVLGNAAAIAQQPAGEVIYAHGITSVQRAGQEARFVAKGDPLQEGDVISTGGRGFAVIGLRDGSKMTLRPDTSFAIDKFSDSVGQESVLLRLVKGGVRALTGLVAKRNPRSVQVTTATSTIGIRGTSFDTRICGTDCQTEARTKAGAAVSDLLVARIAAHAGTGTIVGPDGQARPIKIGGDLFNGDTVRTDKGAYAVLAFRDRSKVTVIAESEFKLEDVRFKGPQADSGNFIVRVVRGGARVLTGVLAKREPKTVRVNMLTAVIGVRGTGFDNRIALDCVAGACSDAVFAYTWEGAIAIQVGDRSLLIETDRAGVYNPAQDRLVLLDKVPQFFFDETAPRPDKVDVDFDKLFGLIGVGYPPGVYVSMRDGRVEFCGKAGCVELGPDEAGYLGEGAVTPVRIAQPPFLLDDPFPTPEKFDEQTIRLLEVLNPGGGPGAPICEM
jgi:hypothetical protein